MKTHNIFADIIFESNLPILDSEYKFIKETKYSPYLSGGGQDSDDKQILNHIELKSLKIKIVNQLTIYAHNILKIDPTIQFYMTGSWANKYSSTEGAGVHCHPYAYMSGVYYVDVPDNSGDIFFHKRSAYLSGGCPLNYSEANAFNSTLYRIQPKKGDLLFFSSDMLHSVSPNLSDKERYSIAFNFFIKGNLGKEPYGVTI